MAEITGVAVVADDRVRALAEEILARPAYREFRRDPTAAQALVARLADWLEKTLGWLPDRIEANWVHLRDLLVAALDRFFAGGHLAVWLRFVLAAVALAVLVAVLVAIFRALRRRVAPAARAAQGLEPPGAGAPRIDEADALAREGRFLEAAHATQLAALELLLRREWIALERSDPNRTLRRRIEAAALPGSERAEFLSLLDRLEGRWFRDRAEDRDLYGAWRLLYGRLVSVAAR